jgi:cytochrome c553
MRNQVDLMRWTNNLLKRGLMIAAALVCVAAAARAQTVADRLAPCLACHGESGTSSTPDVPSLGAQPAYFLLIQLFMFRERLRSIEPMTSMLKGVSDDDLRRMADALAKLPPPAPDASPADPARVERAQELVAQHRCNFCHNGDYSGEQNVPRIAGQREDVLLNGLRGYKDNTRRGYDAQMSDVVEPLTEAEFADLAHFLARLK